MVGNILRLQNIPPLAKAIADKFGALPQVVAVALAGSRTTGAANEASDYDFYVYIQDEIPVNVREAIAREFAQRLEINNQFWEPGDEWIDSNSGCGVDVATGVGVSKVTGSFCGCGLDATGGLKVGMDSGVTSGCGGEVGTTGTGEVWEETGGLVNVGVG